MSEQNSNALAIQIDHSRQDVEYINYLFDMWGKLLKVGTITALAIGEIIYIMNQNRNYRKIGVHIHNLHDLAQERGVTVKEVQHYLRIYKRYQPMLERYGDKLRQLPLTRLIQMATLSDDKVVELLDNANSDHEKAFKNRLLEARGKPTQDTCDHSEQTMWMKCDKCGAWLKPHENN